MEKIIEEINKVIDKIDENISKELSGDDAEEILEEINVDLGKVKKSAKEEQTVVKKIEEIKKGINKSLGETLGFTETQDALNEVKTGLEGVKKEIKKLEESKKNSLLVPQEGGLKRSGSSTSLVDLSEQTRLAANEYVKLGKGALPVVGDLVGAGLGFTHGIVGTGAFFAEKGINEASEGFENVRKGAQEFAEKGMMLGADAFENTRKGAEEVTKQVIKNLDVLGTTKNITDSLTRGIGHAEEVKAQEDAKARIAEADAKARAAEAQARAEEAKAQAEMIKAQVELAKLNLNK